MVPWIRRWLSNLPSRPQILVEPFAGGAAIGLTAVFENLVDRSILIEKDENVAAVWHTILAGSVDWLAKKVANFECTAESVNSLLSSPPRTLEERAFRVLVMNRTRYGGIIAPGAAPVRNGENGHGISSRWYPGTLNRRIRAIADKRNKFEFIHGNGMQFLDLASRYRNVVFFIDPPYTVAGKRLYSYSEIEHDELFNLASKLVGDVLMTYDDAPQIHELARRYGFQVRRVPMRSTKHELKYELLIGPSLGWVDTGDQFIANPRFEDF